MGAAKGITHAHQRQQMDVPDLTIGKARPDEEPLRQPPLAGIIPTCCFRWVISGPSHSGKTNMARYVIEHFYVDGKGHPFFDRIILLSPTAQLDHNWADLPGLSPRDRQTKLNPKWLHQIFKKQERTIKRSGRHRAPMLLIVIDDAVASPAFLNSKEFLQLFISGRHQNISSMFLTQSWCKMPRSARIQATHVSFFPSKKTEVDRLYDEMCPRELTRDEFERIVNAATTKREGDEWPFLYVDVKAGNRRFRRNLTEQYIIAENHNHMS